MATKSCATWYRQSRNASDAQRSYQKLQMQDDYHGQPYGNHQRDPHPGPPGLAPPPAHQEMGTSHLAAGIFAGDECFGGRALNRGIELCAVVEQMYSLQYMFRVQGAAATPPLCSTAALGPRPFVYTSRHACRRPCLPRPVRAHRVA